MTGFLTLTHILKALREERAKMIKDGSLEESGRSKFPVNRNSIVKLEQKGIIDRPLRTQVHLNREDRLYDEEELVKIVAQVRKYAISK
jgi:hypothetical protein